MTSIEFFVRHGVFVLPDFLTTEECARIRREMDAATAEPATIVRDGISQVIEAQRRALISGIDVSTSEQVRWLMEGLRPTLQDHFSQPLAECETPQFLVYREGDKFRPHQDTNGRPGTPDYIRWRRVSVVVFLSSASGRGGAYDGGRLALYNLPARPTWDTARAELTGETGLLVAFPARTYHEVTPVTRGRRHAIVTWFPVST
jgi:PKHD-type hydroxylase